jgi:hypothetical protein
MIGLMLDVVSSVSPQYATDQSRLVVASRHNEDVTWLEVVLLPRSALFQFTISRGDADQAADESPDQRSGSTTGGQQASDRDRTNPRKSDCHDAHASEHADRHSHQGAFFNGDDFVAFDIILEDSLIWVMDGHAKVLVGNTQLTELTNGSLGGRSILKHCSDVFDVSLFGH